MEEVQAGRWSLQSNWGRLHGVCTSRLQMVVGYVAWPSDTVFTYVDKDKQRKYARHNTYTYLLMIGNTLSYIHKRTNTAGMKYTEHTKPFFFV